MRNGRLLLAALLAVAAVAPAAAFDDDPFGVGAGAKAVERIVRRARQGIYTTALAAPSPRSRLDLHMLEWGPGTRVAPDLLAVTGRYALEHLWLSARLSQPAARRPSASFALNWATGPLGWSITAGTDRADSRGLSPGADLTTTYRF